MAVHDAITDALLRAAHLKRERLTGLTQALVRIPSVVGEERALARYLEGAARRIGLEVEAFDVDHALIRTHPAYVPVDAGTEYRDRPNVIATRRGSGGGRPLYLFGHTDTVPVDPRTTWRHEPFAGEIEHGRIYGRGAVDMKGGLAVALVALEVLEELGVRLAGDLAAHFVIEEEAGGNGTLAAVLSGCYSARGACVQLEPTSTSQLVVSNRGAQFFRITVPGEEGGIEYQNELASALVNAVVVLAAVDAYASRREAAADDPMFAGHGTRLPLAICRIEAGAWPSTIPGEAILEGSIECLPGEKIDDVVDAFEEYLLGCCAAHPWLAEHPIRFERFGLRFDAAEIPFDHELVKVVSKAAETVLGAAPEVVGGGGSDLRLPVLYADCPTILFGPGGSPIHSVDEWVSIDQLEAALAVCLLSAVAWCGLAA